MAHITKITSQVCPNICKECRPQCKKCQEISNLDGHELMKFIKTQQEIAANSIGSPRSGKKTIDTDVTSADKPPPPQRKDYLEANMTSCCVTCDTILQQISILLDEIWDILEPQRKVCNICRLAKHGKCDCQQTKTDSLQAYAPRFIVPPMKEGFLSWLTKLRHILLKVLEGVTRSRCKIYRGEPKDELERLLQELRAPLQEQARDIRISSLTKFPLSSTDRDESLVASLIENTELLERVLARIKAEGRKIEMRIFEDQRFQTTSRTSRLPELKVISSQTFPSSMSSFTSTMFPPIPGKTKSDRDEIKSGVSNIKDYKTEQYKRNASRRLEQARSPDEKSLIKSPKDIGSKEGPDYIMTNRKKDGSPHIHGKLLSDDSKYNIKERQVQSANTLDVRKTDGVKKSKSSLSPKEKDISTRKSLKLSVSFPGILKGRKSKGTTDHGEVEPSSMTDQSTEELRKARARVSQQHLYTKHREKRRMDAESLPGDKIQSKEGIIDDDSKKSSRKKSPIKEMITKPKDKFVQPEQVHDDKVKSKEDKTKGLKDIKSSLIKSKTEEQIERSPKQSHGEKFKSKGNIRDEDTESLQRMAITEGKSFTGDKRDKGKRRSKSQGKYKDKELESMSILSNVKIKEGGKSKSTVERKSIAKRGDSEEAVDMNKKKPIKSLSKEKPVPLPQDEAIYTRRQTVQVSSKLILKRMREQKFEEMRMLRRAERMKPKPLMKMKSIKSLPNLEILREKMMQKKREQSVIELLESDLSECPATPKPSEMIRGNRIVPFVPVPKQVYDTDCQPLLFKVHEDLKDDTVLVKDKEQYESTLNLDSQKSWTGKGVTDYRLSNPKFIELGYTKLPTVTVMRKSIVYKMEQSDPEVDWFRRHKQDRVLYYDTCEKLAEIDEDDHGRWYYKNGRMALNYCATECKDAKNRYIVYSSGENDASSYPRCDTILASFDHLGNGIVYDHCGNVRLKYNQNEGENFDKTICPLGRWKWHSLNTTLSTLQNVYVEERVKLFPKNEMEIFDDITNEGNQVSGQFEETAGDVTEEHKTMFTIEMDNFFKEKNRILLQKYQPFQLKMKALKLNEYFTLRIYEQRKIYLYFSVGTRTLKLNLGLILLPTEVLGTETVNLRDIMTPFDRIIPQSESVANILEIVSETRRKMRKKTNFFQKFYSGIRKTSSPVGIIR